MHKIECVLDVSKVPLSQLNNLCMQYGLDFNVRDMSVKLFEVEYA
jgi:hypothetical protein